ncbi:MAG: methyltransferase domain-containing protein [Rhodobacteraceae bacterium]|nr:methyltransferase domain-containing protein [Paracoccaceae bacterium]
MTEKSTGLNAAYDLKSPEDSLRLYRDWAATYDADFARRMDYLMPEKIAAAFADLGTGPVLDIGAGTGLVAEALARRGIAPVDGLDISAEMLAIADGKGVYRRTVVADLTKALPLADRTYRGFVSSGTFTHGHVGPEALDELLRVAEQDALFVLSVHAGVYEAGGFAQKFDELRHAIRDLTVQSVPIYGEAATGEHRDDKALIVSFYRR